MSAPSSPGRFFHEVPDNQPLLKKWLTGLGDEDTFALVLKKYYAHRDAHRPDTIWTALRYAWRPPERNPWQYGAELLEWGLHQPWASAIHVPDIVKAVATTISLSPAENPQAWRTLHTRVPEKYQQTVAHAVADNNPHAASVLSFEGLKLEYLQEWAVLYHTAYQNGIPTAMDMNWRTMCAQTLYRHSDGWSDSDPKKLQAIQEQCQWLTSQLAPEMLTNPTPIWRTAIRYLHPHVWIQEADTIRTIYGTDEKQLAYQLPYRPGVDADACPLNQQLVEQFCPTAFPALQVLLGPSDWADATKVVCTIASMDPGKWDGPPKATPLPLLDNTPTS